MKDEAHVKLEGGREKRKMTEEDYDFPYDMMTELFMYVGISSLQN